MTGTLAVVSTPIGNLSDMTFRGVETLKAASRIACEDTRQTAKLLARYGIRARTVSLHEHNERARAPELLEALEGGDTVALVSDGGTPLISDPGWRLVRGAIERGIAVTWIPGPSALIGALVLSGLPTDRFTFEGFLPVKPGARRRRLETLAREGRTVVLFESPHRLCRLLGELREAAGDVQAACARELSKQFEEVRRGPVSELEAHFARVTPRGEFVVVASMPNKSGTL
ncbi:MAG TPA: 16S rRNA (cytidine(1402)-2'-O)-methyltransferase [bacterium]